MKKETMNLVIGCLAGLAVGLVLTFLTYNTANKALDEVQGQLENCVTVGDVINKVGLKLTDEQKEEVLNIDKNLKVCLSQEYKESLEKQIKDIDLSDFDADSIISGLNEQF